MRHPNAFENIFGGGCFIHCFMPSYFCIDRDVIPEQHYHNAWFPADNIDYALTTVFLFCTMHIDAGNEIRATMFPLAYVIFYSFIS